MEYQTFNVSGFKIYRIGFFFAAILLFMLLTNGCDNETPVSLQTNTAGVATTLYETSTIEISEDNEVNIIHACYIPGSGMIYRIKQDGLKEKCKSPKHIYFRWNEVGPKGDPGPQGPSGNIALAGQFCPEGAYIKGFDANGDLVCAEPGGSSDDGSNGGGNGEQDDLSGTWTLNPEPTLSCPFLPPGFGNISFSSITIIRVSDAELNLAIPLEIGPLPTFSVSLMSPFDSSTESFESSGDFIINTSETQADGAFNFVGERTSSSTIELQIDLTLQLEVNTPFYDFSGTCQDLNLTVVGTQIGV